MRRLEIQIDVFRTALLNYCCPQHLNTHKVLQSHLTISTPKCRPRMLVNLRVVRVGDTNDEQFAALQSHAPHAFVVASCIQVPDLEALNQQTHQHILINLVF